MPLWGLMDTQGFIDAALCEIGDSFAAEDRSQNSLRIVLCQYPNVPPEDIWTALPMLFWLGILNSEKLRSLPYQEFLLTPYWLAVSTHVKDNHPWCVLCTEPLSGPLEVHHRTYLHRGSEWEHLEDLTVLCHECHDWISKKPSRWKMLKTGKDLKWPS